MKHYYVVGIFGENKGDILTPNHKEAMDLYNFYKDRNGDVSVTIMTSEQANTFREIITNKANKILAGEEHSASEMSQNRDIH